MGFKNKKDYDLPGLVPSAVSVDTAGMLLSISRSMAWRMVNSGELRSVRAGKRVLVPMTAIYEFLGDI